MSLLALPLFAAVTAASGPPATPPPEVGGIGVAPPPAWVEVGRRSVWATYGSYCWTVPGKSAACVDMIPPSTRPDIARVSTVPESTVRLHLRFAPRSVRVYRLVGTKRIRVPATAARTVAWSARPGVFDVEVTGAGGSASYVVRLVPPG